MKQIVLVGMKSSGKTSVGRELAKQLDIDFIDVDSVLQARYVKEHGVSLSYREIFQRHGAEYFRAFETDVLRALASELQDSDFVLATGGGTALTLENQELLSAMGLVIFLDVEHEVLLPRITAGGIPAFFPFPDDPGRSLAQLLEVRRPIYTSIAAMVVPCSQESPASIAEQIAGRVRGR